MSSISFKIAAPPRPASSSSSRPPPRPNTVSSRSYTQNNDDSDSDDDAFEQRKKKDELVTGFDSRGVTKKHADVKQGPMIIPSLPNKDWRKAAESAPSRRKKKEMYIPEAAGGMRLAEGAIGAMKTQGGGGDLGTVKDADVVGDEPVVGGLKVTTRETKVEDGGDKMEVEVVEETTTEVVEQPKVVETEEQRALRELLGGSAGGDGDGKPLVEVIMSGPDARGGPLDEGDAFKRDLDSRPDESSLDDYARVPVGEFGTAMLRGMGWKPGQAASRSGRTGPVEAYVPTARPSMLGIGAKPMAEVLGTEKGKNGAAQKSNRREEMRFMPLVRKERDGGSASASGRSTPAAITSGNGTPSSSTRRSASPPPRSSSKRYDDDRDRDRDRDRHTSSSSRRYKDDDRTSSRRDHRDRDDDRKRTRSRSPVARRDDRERSSGYREKERRRDDYDERDRRRDRERDERRRDDDRRRRD